jgi:hypothetical protein
MTIETLDFAEPFFTVRFLTDEGSYQASSKTIVLNLHEEPLLIQDQKLAHLQSVIVKNTLVRNLKRAVVIERFADHGNDAALCKHVREVWPSAFEVRQEERLRGVEHYMSPKTYVGNIGLTMYHSASVPLKVGLHKDHAFCPVPGFREVHTQIVGVGMMQQCLERDVETLYLEECMAPGYTHRPMYDAEGNYPWHQFETITESIFMALEILPEGASFPGQEG